MGYCCNASAHCGNARIATMPLCIAAMPVLLQCLSALPQYLFQCSYCSNIAAMLMLLAMPFNIAAILKRIAAMLPLLHYCGSATIARGIVAMSFGITATPQYFPDVWEVEPPPPILVEDHLEYEVEDLIGHRGHGARQQYLVL